MERLVRNVLASDKFEETVRDGDKGYYDKHEEIFIPKKVLPSLIQELTCGPSVMQGKNGLEGYFALCGIRTKRAITQGLQNKPMRSYGQVFLRYISTEFLKMFVDSKVNFAAMYVDLVGSTMMSMRLSPEKLSVLVGTFTQEMAALVPIHHGFVLKYAGDAVISFFPERESFAQMCSDALECGIAMRDLLNGGINDVLAKSDFKPLDIRVGIEAGSNQIVQIGGDVDILGYTMNIAAKVTSLAKPGGICIGQTAHSALDGKSRDKFAPLKLDPAFWKYQDSEGKPYQVYEYLENSRYAGKGSRVDEVTKIETPKF